MCSSKICFEKPWILLAIPYFQLKQEKSRWIRVVKFILGECIVITEVKDAMLRYKSSGVCRLYS